MPDISPERLLQIKDLYDAAREGTAEKRAALLAQADPELRREVESLLIEQTGGEFLDRPAIQNAPQLLDNSTLTGLALGACLGPYRIESKLGEGGMGEVYRAIDTRLGRAVAIKITHEQFNARFEREARAISSLNHPNICILHDIGPNYLVMELVEGETIAARLKQGPLPCEEAIRYATQIAAALEAAHEKGIIHRDLKPGNVMLTRSGAKVLDFGLATLEGDPTLTTVRMVMGTATYMSPEQARGHQVDARTDIFSLGVVIYELLTRHLPFEGTSIYEIMAAILSDRESPPLSRYSPEVPAELERIVSKALRKNRDERYQTIKDLLLDLQSVKQQFEFDRTHPTRLIREDKAVQVSRVQARRKQLLGMLCLLILVGGTILHAWWKQAQALSQPEIKSLAVLPLKSLDAGENYLGLGIADAAIRRVSQTGRLIVRPTSAVRRYLNEDTDALAAAKQLGVDSVLEGSFQRADDRLRVSVNLLRSRDGASLWTDSFELRMSDIFTIQDTVAQQVASHLRLQLDASQQAQLTKRYTSNPIAYEFYLKGAFTYDQRISAAGGAAQQLKSAIDLYKKAIEADPNFALAHAQLAYCYARLAVFQEPTQPAWVELAKAEIKRAQELDPQLAETHLVRFQLLYSEFEGYQVEAAVGEVRLANQLNPNVGHSELTYLYQHLGLEDLAARELARAYEIDPTSDALKSSTLTLYEVQSKYDEYAADHHVRHEGRSEVWYFMGKGRLDEAQKAMDEWSSKQPGHSELPSTKALLLAIKGNFRAAEAEIPLALRKHPVKDPVYHHTAYDIACIYALEGKSAEAVKWLRESAVTGFHLYPRYERDAYLNRIRQAPEFIQFLAEMKAQNDRYRHEFS
jgi:serine/threonine protein kinase